MRVLPVNDNAVLVELADLAETLALFDALQREPVAGVLEMVPAARTLLIEFAPWATTPARVAAEVARRDRSQRATAEGALVEVPVRYDGEDLAEVAAHLRLTPAEVIARHTGGTWDVAFTGFAPGFAYLTGGDAVFDVPRRASPRTRIPAGSVALAGRYSGIYPRESPGGWQLIGTTAVPMWDLGRVPPAFFQPGQRVRFVDEASAAGQALRERLVAASRVSVAVAPSAAPEAVAPASAPADAGLQVQATGLQALCQDLGRTGQAGQGVSVSGALDVRAFKAANRLVGNAADATAIEAVDGGLTLRALQPVVVAVTGAAGSLTRRSAAGVREAVPRGTPLALDPGDVLSLGEAEAGLRSYVAVRGGFDVAPVLGSRATDTLAGVGPEALRAGQVLAVGQAVQSAVDMHAVDPATALPVRGEPVTLDVNLGPRTEWFGPDALALLTSQDWGVSPQSNRVGVRLIGEQGLQRKPEMVTAELASEGTALGALQVPPNGQPVLFLADHPLTGGYPVIGCVATHHLHLAAQLPVGAVVRFRVVAPFAEVG
ncbi:allophanate hydrolase [Comamonas serinivorans]|uniref:Allophanate hydrolase n=1 Tax=Comamonas serinivorans TaxID=1082851 RepID=A0A1Y0ETC8_9BURK|nr:urea amidolyase family protein [Comamonas serinivorans]ARU06853.1 allophanate hydrolase [Comamonas serinivorans]